jgi:flagellar motor protein MotB
VVGPQVRCSFHFEPASARLPAQASAVIEEILFLSGGRSGLRLSITGYAGDEDGPGRLELAQARADAVMRRLVETPGLDYRAVQSLGQSIGTDAGSGPRGRRVVLTIEDEPGP